MAANRGVDEKPWGTSKRVPGHELVLEGAPHSEDGSVMSTCYGWITTGGVGRAKCRCGAVSSSFDSLSKRKQWHREHKAMVIKQREQHDEAK